MSRITKTARKRKARRLRELAAKAAPDDERFIASLTTKGGNVISKHRAKMGVAGVQGARGGKAYCKAQREKQYQPGFKGRVPSLGAYEHASDYTQRLRVKDGSHYVSQKAWLRKQP